MEFTVKERLVLRGILPAQGKDFVTLTLAKNLSDKLGFASEELEDLNIQVTKDKDGNLTGMKWDKETVKEIAVGPKTVEMVKNALNEIPTDKTNGDYLTLYAKFVGEVKDD